MWRKRQVVDQINSVQDQLQEVKAQLSDDEPLPTEAHERYDRTTARLDALRVIVESIEGREMSRGAS